jgi:eukaryotic-like serine/threonine-protein kinase
MVGQTLAHYRIVKRIASGGMGEVFLAEDTKLDRRVALKTLPAEFATDADRRARLAREAKAIAALNHPNIVTVYSVERVDGVDFITMELVQGRTLAELLPRHGLTLDKFFAIAIPLVDAVAAAHQHGILHRDLKPSNVMVSDDGRVKVLDFGLAKAPAAPAAVSASTISASPTLDGHVMGTPAYMSPEQAEGKAVDTRSDIFSLGVLFYEMLTRQRPFSGDSSASTLASIMKDTPPPIGQLNSNIPRDLTRAVHRCLSKQPIDRYQTAIDFRHDLEVAMEDYQSGVSTPVRADTTPRRGKLGPWVLLAVAMTAVVAVTSLWTYYLRPGSPSAALLGNAVQVTSTLTVESYPTWSPDGLRLAYQSSDRGWIYVGDHDIWVAQVGGGEPVNLTKDSPANDRMPSWSPDGRQIAFFSDRSGEWAVYTVSAIGGQPRGVLHLGDRPGIAWSAPQWSKDGTQLYVSWNQAGENVVLLLSLDSSATTRVVLPRHEGNYCWDLSVRPDGGRLAYVEGGGGATDVTRLWTISASGGGAVPLTDGRTDVWSPTWSGDGRAIFFVSNRGGTRDLWRQAVDDDGRPIGEPTAITAGVGIRTAAFSSDRRKLAYTRGGRVANVFRVPLLERPATWAEAQQLTVEHAEVETLDLSPDGKTLALSSDRRGNKDLWLVPSTGGEMTQLTIDPTPDWSPRWSPDGMEIAFYAYRSGNRDVWVMPARGGPARQLSVHVGDDSYPVWSPEGREIAFWSRSRSLTLIVDAKGSEPRPLNAVISSRAEWSPDGKWLLVQRDGQRMRVARDGSHMSPLPSGADGTPAPFGRFAADGQWILYTGALGSERARNVWKWSLIDGRAVPLTRLDGRRGDLGNFVADRHYLYFTWREDEGDIWVMDVVTPARR